MARRSNIHHREPKLNCPFRGCHQKFRNQTGRTKHIRVRHEEDELPVHTRTQNSLVSSSNTRPVNSSFPIDSDSDSDTMPAIPYHDDQASNGTNITRTPSHDDSLSPFHPSSPLPFNPSSPLPFQPEVEEVPTLSINYHPFLNGVTRLFFL
jgi:hypothetical protein